MAPSVLRTIRSGYEIILVSPRGNLTIAQGGSCISIWNGVRLSDGHLDLSCFLSFSSIINHLNPLNTSSFQGCGSIFSDLN